MAVAAKSPRVPWKVETMRLTAFTLTADQADPDMWWDSVVGSPPESKLVKMKGASQMFEGIIDSRKLVLNVEVNRVDWVIAPNIGPDEDLKDVPNVGAFEDVSKSFEEMSLRWLAMERPIQRLAWGATLLLPVADRKAGYHTLGKYLPSVKLDPDTSADFLYQINRWKKSSVIPDLIVNVLQKWSVMKIQRIVAQIPSTGGGIMGAVTGEGFDACRIELDINSAPDYQGSFNADQAKALYFEFAGYGAAVAAKGELG